VTTKLTGNGFGISEVRSLCGVDTTGLAASLATLLVGLPRKKKRARGENEPSHRLIDVTFITSYKIVW